MAAIRLSDSPVHCRGFNVVVCASGGGGNFQAIIDAQVKLDINISHLVVDRQCGAIDRALKSGIPYTR